MNVSKLKDDHSFHRKAIHTLPKKAKARWQRLGRDDVEEMYSFHIAGKCRLWCLKYENILSILWWDRHHEVHPVAKKGS